MPQLLPALAKVLAAINDVTPVTWGDDSGKGEWFYIESRGLGDLALFTILRQNWHKIAGPQSLNFALVYCQNEPDAGVWLHHLPTWQHQTEYLPGCHQIPSWF